MEELNIAIKGMKCGKSPGSDGLSTEFNLVLLFRCSHLCFRQPHCCFPNSAFVTRTEKGSAQTHTKERQRYNGS